MSDIINTDKMLKLFKRKTDSMQFKAKSYIQGKMNQTNYHYNKVDKKVDDALKKTQNVAKRKFNTNVVRPIRKFMGSIK